MQANNQISNAVTALATGILALKKFGLRLEYISLVGFGTINIHGFFLKNTQLGLFRSFFMISFWMKILGEIAIACKIWETYPFFWREILI